MVFGKLLQPDLVLGDSILGLTLEVLHQHGLRGLVLDVDETLVPIRTADVSDEIKWWVASLKPSVALWLVSNNISQSRIGRIAQILDLPYISGAKKPSRRGLRQAAEAMNIPIAQVAMVGDRLFTDVLAGNRLGMFTILVEPMIISPDVVRRYPIRSFEVWLSQVMGASISQQQQQRVNLDETQETEI
jgi:HAD superfamily phosphatase (TIGR01668 family)